MRGGEYLDATCLASLWRALEHALDDEVGGKRLAIKAFPLAQTAVAARRARPFQPRRKPQGVGPPVRLHGDLRLDARAAGRPFAISDLAMRCANMPEPGEGRAPQALGAGQPRKREPRPG